MSDEIQEGTEPESQASEDNLNGETEMGEGHFSNLDENLEEGELEDGEIDDDPTEVSEIPNNDTIEPEKEEQSGNNESKSKSTNREKKKRKRKQEKSQDREKKRGKRKKYIDHDRIDEDDDGMPWLGEQQQHHHHHHRSHKSRRHKEREDSEMYDSSYDSPPGPYDSPSDGEGDDRGPSSMLGLVQDDFMDVSISAQERQERKEKQHCDAERRERKMKKKYKNRINDGSKHNSSKKTPLVELPLSERPYCKFFKEGKCSKGSNCPFNHDFQPEKRLDVCKFYLTSACNRENCVFMHDEFPCKYFHTGKVCYAGDECKFSHDPMSEEMEEYFERMLEEENQPKKPSLLGSPPRHVVEEAEKLKERIEQVKKIPSIFDIETFPPGQSPRKPSPQKNTPPPRPSGFYNESGPPPGPMNNQGQGPPHCPPMANLGPPMNNLRPPMGGPMGPPMGPLGPLSGPPPMGPMMNCPRPGFPGPPDMGNNAPVGGSVLNMIGAILRTAAPLIVNQIPGKSGGQVGDSPSHPGASHDGMTTSDQSGVEEEDEATHQTDISDTHSKDIPNEEQDNNLSSPPNKPLDPRARMRLAARNDLRSDPFPLSSSTSKTDSDDHVNNQKISQHSSSEEEKPGHQPEMNFGPKFEFGKDDNWYSSDEDNDDGQLSSKPNLTKSSTINIMEMISNVKNDKSLHSSTQEPIKQQSAPSFYSPSMTLSQSYNTSTEDDVPVTHCVLTSMLYRIKTFTFVTIDKPYDRIPKDIDPLENKFQSDPRVQKYCARLARKTAMAAQVTMDKKVERVQLPDLNLNLDGTINTSKSKPIDPRMSRNSSSDEHKQQILDPRARSDPRVARNNSSEDKPVVFDPRISRSVSMEDQKPKACDPRMRTNTDTSSDLSRDSKMVHDPRRSRNVVPEANKLSSYDPRVSRQNSADEQKIPFYDPRMRRSQQILDSSSIKNNLALPSEPFLDPRVSRSYNSEEGLPNLPPFSLDKAKSKELQLGEI